MKQAAQLTINCVELAYIPDTVIRSGMRHMCARRLCEFRSKNSQSSPTHIEHFVVGMDAAPLGHSANRASR